MKTANILLIALLTALVACSDSGGGGAKPKGPSDFEPARKPANAVSPEDLKHYQAFVKTNAQYLPQAEVVFANILSGARAEPVKPEEFQEAQARLNADGQQVALMMKSRCNIVEAQSTLTGDNEMRVGATQIEKGSMALTEKAGCPILMKKDAESKSVITDIAGDSSQARIKMDGTLNETTHREVKDDYLHYRTNSRSFSMQMATRSKSEVTFKQDSMGLKANIVGSGTMAYEMVDGDYMRGPITVEANLDSASNNGQFQALYDLQTSRGALRIVMIGTEAGTEAYINGEKVNLDDLGPLATLSGPVLKEAARLQALAPTLR